MANELIKQNYKDIANAIRSKTGKNGLMTADEMPTEIEGIETGITPTGNKPITTTAQVDVTEFATAQVQEPNLVAANIKKDVSILGIVGTNEGYPEPTGTVLITSNSEYAEVKDYEYANVEVHTIIEDSPYGGDHTDWDWLQRVLNSKHDDQHERIITTDDSKHIYFYLADNYFGIEISKSASWYDFKDNPVTGKILPGCYESDYPHYNPGIVIANIDISSDEDRCWHFSFNITYTDYDGGGDEYELANEWQSYIGGKKVYNMLGQCIGCVESEPTVEVHFYGGC